MTEDLDQLRSLIGLPGTVRVTSANRNLVRRYLCAQGRPSPEVRAMTLAQLADAYNGQQDSGPTPAPRAEGGGQQQRVDATPAPAPDADSDGTPDSNQLAAMLAQALQRPAGLSADDVRRIVREESPGVQRIEIQTPEGDTREVEGPSHYALPRLIRYLSAGVHVWLAGPAGSGKTTLASQAAEALGLAFYATGAVSSDFRLLGFIDATGALVRTPFREAFEHGGVFLWDEVDASSPNALVAFNMAIANGSAAFPDGMIERHPDFVCIAAANTWGHGATAEYCGRTRIDAATIDRFVALPIDYDNALEDGLAGQFPQWARAVQSARQTAREHGIKAVISPRATVHGARLLAAGEEWQEVAEATIRRGMDDNTWQKLHAPIERVMAEA